MNSQEPNPGGVATLCSAGEVKDEQQATVASGRRLLGRRQAKKRPLQILLQTLTTATGTVGYNSSKMILKTN